MNAIVAEQEPDNVTELRSVPGPGERLRNARIAMDMDISKAAKKLHLTGDMVDALECDDYSEMPARVFVRGYVRNYARLVDLPVESVIGQFDQLWPEDETALKVDHAPKLASDTKPGGGAWGSLLTWLLVVGGAVLFLLWWLGHLDGLIAAPKATDEPAPVVQPGLPAAEPAPRLQPAPATPAAPGSLTLPPAAPVSEQAPEPDVLPVAVAPVPQPTPTAVPDPEVAIAEAIEPAPSVAQENPPGEPEAAPAAVAEPAPESAPEPVPETAPVVVAPVVPQVKVAFSEDCWVDIRSADRQFRLFGTMRKGTVRTLGGEAPYRMILGNAGAVSLTVDGKAFDLAPHTRENIARLTFTP